MLITDFNASPYYDDFDGTKGFHRVLFRPSGVAVQARELTTLQTLLQEQIARFGRHVFVDGSVVVGCAESTNFNVPTVKIRDRDFLNVELSDDVFAALEGATLVGQSSGVSGIVRKVASGSEAEVPNLKTLYVQYTASGTEGQETFAPGEVLLSTTGISVIVAPSGTDPIGQGSLISIGEGIIFSKGMFIFHAAQTGIVDRYGTAPTKRVGIQLLEEVVTHEDDVTLLDPAYGSFNYAAPGADRYKVTTQIVSVSPSEPIPDGFFVLFEIEDGSIKRRYNISQYAELNKTLARRTFDESGDYTVRPFPMVVREHLRTDTNNGRYAPPVGDNAKLVVAINPGKAYVRGYEHELFSTEYVSIDKAITTDTKQNHVVSTVYGSYVEVTSITGAFPVGTGEDIVFRDGLTVVAQAKLRDLVFVGGSVYRLYIYDLRVTGNLSLADTVRFGATAQANLVEAKVYNTRLSANIFNVGYQSMASISDASFVYKRTFSGTTVTGGVLNISVSSPETFAFSSVVGNTDDVIVVTADGVYRTISNVSVVGTTATITLGTVVTTTATVYAKVRRTTTHNTKLLRREKYVIIDTSTGGYSSTSDFFLGVPDVFKIDGVWSAPNSTVVYPDDPATNSAWTDVTEYVALNTGQTDAIYGMSSIRATDPALFVNKKLIVRFSYFLHTSISPYYTVQSYPLPALNALAADDQIEWYDIPTYTSTGGTTYNLRDCIDFRPTVTSTAVPADLPSAAVVNPTNSTTFIANSIFPSTEEEFIGDVEFFLPRIDRVVLDAEGEFYAVQGIPALNPLAPRQPDNTMTLGFINLPAYPTVSPFVAKQVNLPSNAAKVSVVDNRRFTMKDIGQINRRVGTLEYYTKLSLLEASTAKLLIGNTITNDRFKNGILVDPFFGHNIGNVLDAEYNCSIADNQLRPSFTLYDVPMELETTNLVQNAPDAQIVVRQFISAPRFIVNEVVTNGAGASGTIVYSVDLGNDGAFRWSRLYLTNVTTGATFAVNNTVTSGLKTGTIIGGITGLPALVSYAPMGPLLTLPYHHSVFAQVPVATRFRVVKDSLTFTTIGRLSLSPKDDMFMDTGYTPEVLNNPEGKYDNWKRLDTPWGTQWNSWVTAWQGKLSQLEYTRDQNIDEVTASASQRETLTPVGVSVGGQLTTNIGSRELSSDILPWTRARVVSFSGTQMKRNTRLYAFFDGVNVSEFCGPTLETLGDALVADATGAVSGVFVIPANTFTSGTKIFTLSDNDITPLSGSTICSAGYNATGVSVIDDGSILSTTPSEVTVSRQRQTIDPVAARLSLLTSTTSVDDPMAQSFNVSGVPGGIFITKVDLFFRTKESAEPMTVQIRNVVNGVPGDAIVPYSTATVRPEDINISTNASAPTTFVFESPVYLKNDTEYCLVLMPSGASRTNEVWTSEVSRREIGGSAVADRRPNIGQLFISGNGQSWTNLSNESLKMTIHRASFVTTSGTATFRHSPIVRIRVSDVSQVSAGHTVLSASGGMGTIQWIEDNSMTLHIVPSNSGSWAASALYVVRPLGGTITTTTGSSALVGTGTDFTVLSESQRLLTATGSTIGFIDAVTDQTNAVFESNALVALTNDIAFVADAVLNKTADVTVQATALSMTLGYLDFIDNDVFWQYQSGSLLPESLSDAGTTELRERVNITNTTPLRAIATLTTSSSTSSPVIDRSRINCIAINNMEESTYITRRVVLDDGQEAEDFRVYINANVPLDASVRVFARLQSPEDERPFNELAWVELDGVSLSPTSTSGDILYTLPTSTLNGSGVYAYDTFTGFKTFAVKIVLDASTNPASVPVVFNMRAIALQA